MRVLMVHNYYGSSAPSGENKVFESEVALLRSRGNDVLEFCRNSDEIRKQGVLGVARGAFSTPWNPFAARKLLKVIEVFVPDVVHAHNTFPLISPAIFRAVGARAGRVLTLHNYRLFCPAAIPMRAGEVCTDCLDTSSIVPALRHRCYRGSRLATMPLALNVALHRRVGTWEREVDAYVALTEFQRAVMVGAGLPLDRVHVKPNFYPGHPIVLPWESRGPYVVFAGRLGPEKGVETLLHAWRLWGAKAPELRLVGDGELRSKLKEMALGLPVRFLGQLSEEEAQAQIAQARLLVLPSECFEGFPMVIREAFAFGTPVAVSDLGPLPSIATQGVSGLVFKASSPEALFHCVQQAWEVPGYLEKLGFGARTEFELKYNEDANYQTLMGVYDKAKSVSARGGK